jgi:hypothetical protein
MLVCVFEEQMDDVEDPQVYAAIPLFQWEQSESGKWVKANALCQPVWHIIPSKLTYTFKVIVTADLAEEDITYFKLKWGKFK